MQISRYMPCFLFAFFTAICVVACFLPIQTDEVFYKLIYARLFTDNGELTTLFPQCEVGFSTSPPLLWILPRTLDWLIYHSIENIFLIRVIGVIAAAVIIGLFIWVVKLLGHKTPVIYMLLAVLSLDTMPLILTINRPEQNMVITLTCLIILYLIVCNKARSTYNKLFGGCVLYMLLANYFFALHPKALMFLPVVLVIGWTIGLKTRNYFIAAFLGIFSILCAFVSYNVFMLRADCSEQPLVQAGFGNNYLSPDLFLQSPADFFLRALSNVSKVLEYFYSLWNTPRNTADWIPESTFQMNDWHRFFDGNFSQAVGLLFAVGFCLVFCHMAVHCWRAIKEKHIEQNHLIALLMLCGILLVAMIQSVKMFYEVVLVAPLSILVALLIISPHKTGSRKIHAYVKALMVLALVSQANLLIKYAPYALPVSARAHDRVLSIEDARRLIMADTSFYGQTKHAVLSAAEKCGIKPDMNSKHVVTDMLTYSYFTNTYKPLSLDYILGSWYTQNIDIGGFERVLQSKASFGVITLCAATPDIIRQKMIQTGDFCCLKPAW